MELGKLAAGAAVLAGAGMLVCCMSRETPNPKETEGSQHASHPTSQPVEEPSSELPGVEYIHPTDEVRLSCMLPPDMQRCSDCVIRRSQSIKQLRLGM